MLDVRDQGCPLTKKICTCVGIGIPSMNCKSAVVDSVWQCNTLDLGRDSRCRLAFLLLRREEPLIRQCVKKTCTVC